MSDVIAALQASNRRLNVKIIVCVIIFTIQLYTMNRSLRYFMGDESAVLWLPALLSITLFLLSLLVLLFFRKII